MSLWIGNFTATVTMFFCNWIFFPVLVAVGIYFMIQTRFFPFRAGKELLRVFAKHKESGKESFHALLLDLSSKVVPRGIWSISAAISFPVLAGGYGAVFWMWLFSLLGLSVSFLENLLSQLSRRENGTGGIAFLVHQFLHSRLLGIGTALFILLSLYGMISIQSHEIVQTFSSWLSFQGNHNWPLLISMILIVTIAYFFFGGRRQILETVSVLLPLSGLLYLGIGLIIFVQNISHVPSLLSGIFADAWSPHSISCGGIGAFFLRNARSGIGWTVNSPVSGCAAASPVGNPVRQAAIQTLGTFVLLSLVGISTICILFLSGIPLGEEASPIKLLQDAAYYQTGRGGSLLFTVSLSLLSFCAILSSHYAGEVHYAFLFPSQKGITFFRLTSLAAAAAGIFLRDMIPWYLPIIPLVPCFILTISALIMGRKEAFAAIRNYQTQKNQDSNRTDMQPEHPTQN